MIAALLYKNGKKGQNLKTQAAIEEQLADDEELGLR
jgi:hypothetical protein